MTTRSNLLHLLPREAWGLVRVAGQDRLVRATTGPSGISLAPALPDEAATAGDPRHAHQATRARVTLALQDFSVRHERVHLPAMKSSLVERAIHQHCAAEAAPGVGLEVSYTADRAPHDPADYLVASVDRAGATRAAAEAAQHGHPVDRLVTPAVALTGLLGALGTLHDAQGATVLIHLGERVGSAAIIADGVLALGREFGIAGEERGGEDSPTVDEGATAGPGARSDAAPGERGVMPAAPGEDFLDLMLEEIDRSLLFFNHRLQGRAVGRILLSSDVFQVRPLCALCAERFGVQAVPFLEAVDLDTSHFGDGDFARRMAGRWILPIAAAVTGLLGRPDIDLLPQTLVLDRTRRRAITLAAAVLLTCAIGMGAYHVAQVAAAYSQTHDLKTEIGRRSATEVAIEDLDGLRRERAGVRRQQVFLADKQFPVVVLQQALAALSRSAPDSLCIERLDLARAGGAGGGVVLNITGRVGAPESAEAQGQFNAFYRTLRRDALFRRADVQPLVIETSGENGHSILRFEIVAPIAPVEGNRDADA